MNFHQEFNKLCFLKKLKKIINVANAQGILNDLINKRKNQVLNAANSMHFKEKEIPTRYDFDRYEGNSSLAYSWSP